MVWLLIIIVLIVILGVFGALLAHEEEDNMGYEEKEMDVDERTRWNFCN